MDRRRAASFSLGGYEETTAGLKATRVQGDDVTFDLSMVTEQRV